MAVCSWIRHNVSAAGACGAASQAAAEKKGQEVRELNHMLKAWEAMRLGKDAQVSQVAPHCAEAGMTGVEDSINCAFHI